MPHPIELLAPARDLACGIAAIEHGADAVYIGAPHHGARAAATNSIADIRSLCDFAHRFRAKVYATVNTIVYDEELEAVQAMIGELEDAGIDALLVQDMATTRMRHRVPLHASTQTDASSAERVRWLAAMGFRRVVLARELSIAEMAAIHREVPGVELEAFVHGALCVGSSGLCYASQHCFRRSANRGECAQVCRLPFDLVDGVGRTLVRGRHLLSLRDLCQIDNLDAIVKAGVVSLKIEGRLKDVSYVAGVVAAYNQRLEQLGVPRASIGRSRPKFTPDLGRVFHRPYTDFFARGRQPGLASIDTPKAVGEYVGQVKDIGRGSFTVSGITPIHNGDGLCFFDAERQLQGFRANRAEGNRVWPRGNVRGLGKGMRLYRNADTAFAGAVAASRGIRHIGVDMELSPTADGYKLRIAHSAGSGEAAAVCPHEQARTPQQDNIRRILSKLGGTIYEAGAITMPDGNPFIPASVLTSLRQRAVEDLERQRTPEAAQEDTRGSGPAAGTCPPYPSPAMYNIANHIAAAIYREHGIEGRAYELAADRRAPLMTCRYCIRHELGQCLKKAHTWKGPLALLAGDGRRLRLNFDCARCMMTVEQE